MLTCSSPPPQPAKIRIDNLHWDLSEDDLYVRRAGVRLDTSLMYSRTYLPALHP